MNYLDPPLADMLAAEYVLGTLHGAARRRFETLLRAHPALSNRVHEWELRLNRLAQFVSPTAPPKSDWDALQERLFSSARRPRWFEGLRFWRNLGLGSSVLAGALAIVIFAGRPVVEPNYVGMISDAAHQAVWMVSAPAAMGAVHVKNMKPVDLPPGKRCMLWLQPKGSDSAYALGLLPEQGDEMTLDIPSHLSDMMPGKLLVTVEQINGAMPAKPSGKPEFEGDWIPLT